MYQGHVRSAVAMIVLGGHFFVFISGLGLGAFGPLSGADTAQAVLTACPVLGVTATAALMWVLRGELGVEIGNKVSLTFVLVVIFFPIALIVCLAGVLFGTYKQVHGFGPDQMKLMLGAIETFFGVFLGAISNTLFGSADAPMTRGTGTNRGD